MTKAAKPKPRRQTAHRQRAAPSGSVLSRYREAGGPARTLIAVLFIVLVYAISQIGGDAWPYRVGQRIDNDILARVTFELEKTAETEQRRETARRTSPNVFVLNTALLEGIRGQLNLLLNIAKENQDDYQAFAESAGRAGFEVTEEAFQDLSELSATQPSAEYARWVDGLLYDLSHERIVTPVERTAPSALLRREGEEDRTVDASLIQPAGNTKHLTQISQQLVWRFPQALQPIVSRVIMRAIQVDPEQKQYEPVFEYDKELTRALMEERIAKVQRASITYQAGEPLVHAGKLTEGDLQLLTAEHQAYLGRRSQDTTLRQAHLLSAAGTFAVLFVIVMGLCLYVLGYEPRVVRKLGRSFGLAALLLLMLLAARLLALRGLGDLTPATVVMTAALLTILYNQRFALGVTSVQALLTCLLTDWRLASLVTAVSTSWTCIFLLRDIRTRSKVITVGMFAAVLGFVLTVADGFVEKQDFRDFILPRALLTSAGILMVGFVVQGILPGIERVFGVATSMTLLEWCDASRPLLKRLAQDAPGTYSHSLMLSNMVEAAADAIGANGLLAKVGALYHDIGKIPKPDYFTENQQARINRHDKLSPTMSLMIIRGHVKDGIEMAREYGLPRVLLPFIEEHHGTTLVKYFLRVASEKQSSRVHGRHDREVSEAEFRYPGPKPRMRESAILMICDGAEGAVRSLTEPSAARIESTVHKLVMDRLTDGQFDGCGITMQELHRVEESVVKTLQSTYHGRIPYPKEGEPTRTEAETAGDHTKDRAAAGPVVSPSETSLAPARAAADRPSPTTIPTN